MEGLFFCNSIQLPGKAGKGTRARAREFLEANVPGFCVEKHYYCGIEKDTMSTAIAWKNVCANGSDKYNQEKPDAVEFKYDRYYIVKFDENSAEWKCLEKDDRKQLVKLFSSKSKTPGADLSRVNIEINIGEK